MFVSGTTYSHLGTDDQGFHFSIFITDVPENRRGQRIHCAGPVPPFPRHTPVILDGDFQGDIFVINRFIKESSLVAIRQFLTTISLCTASMSEKITRMYNGRTIWDLSINDLPRLTGAHIDQTAAMSVISVFSGIRNSINTLDELLNFGWKYESIGKFFNEKHLIDEVYSNPYDIGYKCDVSLEICDRCASTINNSARNLSTVFSPHCKERISFIIRHVADSICQSGHAYVTLKELECHVKKEVKKTSYEKADADYVSVMALSDRRFFYDGINRIYLTYYHSLEQEAAAELTRINRCQLSPILVNDDDLKKYDAEQQSAIKGILSSNPISVLRGGPGTGKTTTARMLVKTMEEAGQKVLLAAPTGRAAVRISESTGHPASTIHRMLGIQKLFSGDYHAVFNQDHPLEADAVIIDETSMVSIDLFVELLKAIPDNCRLIMIGDPNQLPSVSPGNVLQDIIESGVVPVYELKTIHRQKNGSSIIDNSYLVIDGKMPVSGSDFDIIQCTEDMALNLVVSIHQSEYSLKDPCKIQILCPVKDGILGTKNINNKILSNDLSRKTLRGSYAIGDKVMTIRNSYDPVFTYMNGDIGIIEDILDDMLVIKSDKQHLYVKDTVDMQHAYATTIHKSQGSEYDHVVIIFDEQNSSMMYRNLLYTAITRAKKKVTILYTGNALHNAVMNTGPKRNSGLVTRLRSQSI